MHSEFVPALTRFDVVMAFLRAQLWITVLGLVAGAIMGFSYLTVGVNPSFYGLRIVGATLVPVLLLFFFPTLLASNALGGTARDSVTSVANLRPLVGRCAGLFLFVQSLGQVVVLTGTFLYAFASHPGGSILGALSGITLSGRYMWLEIGQIASPLLSFLIGFFLAFGPTIRDNFRGR